MSRIKNNTAFSKIAILARTIIVTAANLAIRSYQILISPLLGTRCRFYPSCSKYCAESLNKHGLLKGGLLSISRILRCNPFFPGGLDPVPDKASDKK